MPDINSLKKAIKWMFCDKVVIFSAVVGIILLLVTLIVFAESVDLIKYRGMKYSAGGTVYCRLLIKLTTPALAVNRLLKSMPVITIPQYLILYSLMFAVQIIVYGVVGKVASVMSSGRIVAVCICIGIVLLALAIAYEINLAQGPNLDIVKGRPFYLLLIMSNMPALFIGQHLLGIFGNTAILYLILFPFMFIVQIFLYSLLGRLVGNMLSG